jgi:UDP-glucuronate decarboxylase
VLTSNHNGEAFNVGRPEEVSMRSVAALIGELFDIKDIRTAESADKRYLTDNPQRRCPDIGKIRDQVGWTPGVTLREGLRRTVSYYRERQLL